MEQLDTILACPFCGDEAYVSDPGGGVQIRCENQDCAAQPFVDGDDLPQAVEAWNRRAGANGALSYNRGERLAPASWLDALRTCIASAKSLKAISEGEDDELSADVATLQDHLEELLRQMGERI